jgi:hypothetical protein
MFVKCFRWLVFEKLKLSREDLIGLKLENFFTDYKLISPATKYFSTFGYAVIESFPEYDLRLWEFKFIRKLDKDNATQVIKEYIENELGLGKDTIQDNLSVAALRASPVGRLFATFFEKSLVDCLNTVYPDEDWSHLSKSGRYTTGGLQRTKSLVGSQGIKNPSAKLDWEKIDYIRSSSTSARELAEKFQVSASTIHRIKAGALWKK